MRAYRPSQPIPLALSEASAHSARIQTEEVLAPPRTRGGPALGGQDLTKSFTCQIGAPSRTDNANARPCLSDQVTTTEPNERRGRVKERRSELFALKQEVVRRSQLLRHRSRTVTKWRHSSCRLLSCTRL